MARRAAMAGCSTADCICSPADEPGVTAPAAAFSAIASAGATAPLRRLALLAPEEIFIACPLPLICIIAPFFSCRQSQLVAQALQGCRIRFRHFQAVAVAFLACHAKHGGDAVGLAARQY